MSKEPKKSTNYPYKIAHVHSRGYAYNLLTKKEQWAEFERRYFNSQIPKIPKIKADRRTVGNWIEVEEIYEMITDLINGVYTVEGLRQDYDDWVREGNK